jgi:hypothetical protein
MGLSAAEGLAEAERRGARFRVVGERLEATPKLQDRALYDGIGRHKATIIVLLRARGGDCAADAVLYTQALLRQGRFPLEPAPCAYHCGHARERCRRCGGSLGEHLPTSYDAQP